jgi:hypothetical protein
MEGIPMTNEQIKAIMVEVIGKEEFPPCFDNDQEWFSDAMMQTYSERIVTECINAVDTGDANLDTLVRNQIRTQLGIAIP